MEEHKKNITIAIDGYSSCGKSTMAKDLAVDLGYVYIDTGAMYRAVTLYTLTHGLWLDEETPDEAAINKVIDQLDIRLRREGVLDHVYLNGMDVTKEIRSMEVSRHVSHISALKAVREKLTREQQAMGEHGGIVMDGRDIGTSVFPGAELKIFVTANPEVRAERRLLELRSKGDEVSTLEEVKENLLERDRIDSTRKESPLRQAADARVLDNSNISKEEQREILLEMAREVIAK